MKGFALDAQGDIIIQKGEIQMIYGSELTAQTIKSVLSTQKGEWFLNVDEGINLDNILGKKLVVSEDELSHVKQAYADSEADKSELNEKLARRLDGMK